MEKKEIASEEIKFWQKVKRRGFKEFIDFLEEKLDGFSPGDELIVSRELFGELFPEIADNVDLEERKRGRDGVSFVFSDDKYELSIHIDEELAPDLIGYT